MDFPTTLETFQYAPKYATFLNMRYPVVDVVLVISKILIWYVAFKFHSIPVSGGSTAISIRSCVENSSPHPGHSQTGSPRLKS